MTVLTNVTDYSFDAEVLKNDLFVIADFWAEWSGSCKAIEPLLEQMVTSYSDRVKVVKVDIESNPIVTSRYEVLTVPTIILFKNGQVVERMDGKQVRESLKERTELYLHEFAK